MGEVYVITAILEDKKGFKKSMDIAKFMPYIKIAIPPELALVTYFGKGKDEVEIEILEFYHYKWLDDKCTVATYREK